MLKVFHAGGQDLEIIHNLTGKTPHPLFDTQIAAMALGHGEQIGYSNLVESLLGHSLDKGARFTDWSRRPLDKRQIDYAIADVTHLATIFPRMLEKLKKTGRGAWLDEEMERLADPSSFAFPPEDAWKRLKLPSRNPAVLGRLKALAAWRETEARAKNLPRGRIIKDETLAEIVAPPAQEPGRPRPNSRPVGRLAEQRHRRAADGRDRSGQAARPADELPDREPRRPGLTKDGALVSDLLKLLLKIRAKETGVAARLIARSDELEALAAGVREDLKILSRLALRAIRQGRARPGRGPARLRDRERQAQDEPGRADAGEPSMRKLAAARRCRARRLRRPRPPQPPVHGETPGRMLQCRRHRSLHRPAGHERDGAAILRRPMPRVAALGAAGHDADHGLSRRTA